MSHFPAAPTAIPNPEIACDKRAFRQLASGHLKARSSDYEKPISTTTEAISSCAAVGLRRRLSSGDVNPDVSFYVTRAVSHTTSRSLDCLPLSRPSVAAHYPRSKPRAVSSPLRCTGSPTMGHLRRFQFIGLIRQDSPTSSTLPPDQARGADQARMPTIVKLGAASAVACSWRSCSFNGWRSQGVIIGVLVLTVHPRAAIEAPRPTASCVFAASRIQHHHARLWKVLRNLPLCQPRPVVALLDARMSGP